MKFVGEETIQTPQGRIAAKKWGTEQGPSPILALHGWLDNAASFDPLMERLDGGLALAIDLPGHGRSAHLSPDAYYHYIDSVPRVLAILDVLGWRRCTLVGHSMGAGIAMLIAASVPTRIEKLVLLDGMAPLASPADEMPRRVSAFLTQAERLKDKQVPIYGSVEGAAQARQQATGLSYQAALRLAQRGTRPAGDGVTWSADPRLRLPSPMRFTVEQVTEFLGRLECPTLLAKSSEGELGARMPFEQYASQVKRLESVEIQGGHHVHLEDPERVAPIVNSFLTIQTSRISSSL